MQKSIQKSWLILLVLVCSAAVPTCSFAQKAPKGWTIEFEQDWLGAPFGYQFMQIKVSNSPPAPVKKDVEFDVVVTQHQNGRVHSVTVTPLVVKKGDTSAEVDVLINKAQNSYNNYFFTHIERDGNLYFDHNRDLCNFYTYLNSYGSQQSGLPTILFISSEVTNNVTKQIRTRKNVQTMGSGKIFTINEAKFPEAGVLYPFYPDANGQPIGASTAAKKNPTTMDAMESPWLHAIDIAKVPNNWLALTSAEIIVVSYADLVQVAKNPAKTDSIRKWLAAGGTLVVNDAGTNFERASNIRALLDGKKSLSARRKNPWMLPGAKIRKLEKFVIHEREPNAYYFGGVQQQNEFASKVDARKAQDDWHALLETDDLAQTAANQEAKFAMYNHLLGKVIVVNDDMISWTTKDWKFLLNSIMLSGRTISEHLGGTNANIPEDNFAIQGVGKPPVKEFQYLIGLFVFAIGPLSYFILKKKRRLQLLFITVPAISLVACTGLVSYALLSDGFENRGRMRSFTAVDHNRQHAISFVRHSQYAGVQPDNYEFGNDTAVFNGRAWTSPRTVIHQHRRKTSVNGGDIRPRMPHQLVSIQNYETSKRLRVIPGDLPTEAPVILNQFDDPVRFAIVRTERGYFYVENLAAGSTATSQEIELNGKKLRQSETAKQLRDLVSQISPNVKDDFFSRSAYANDPYYGYYSSTNSDKPSTLDCDFQFSALFRNIDEFFPSPRHYIAILEEYSSIPPPQPDIQYKNKLHIIHGKW